MMINNANELKAHLLQQNKNRLQSDQFDMNAALEDILNSVGYSTADSGGKVTFYGKDPVMPSTLRLASLVWIRVSS